MGPSEGERPSTLPPNESVFEEYATGKGWIDIAQLMDWIWDIDETLDFQSDITFSNACRLDLRVVVAN